MLSHGVRAIPARPPLAYDLAPQESFVSASGFFALERLQTLAMGDATGSTTPGSLVPQKRVRNARATREAILKSALIAFSKFGYDGIGVREIAREAGVTAMLVNRYFGSKEKLFAVAVETIFAEGTLLSGDAASLSRQAARALLEEAPPGTPVIDPFLLMLHSAPNPRAAEILCDNLERYLQRPLSAALPGGQARERAMLFLGLIAGFRLMYTVIRARPLVEADRESLARRLEALFQLLVLPELPEKK